MAKWKCDCGYDRELRSDGWVETCAFCDGPEIDALRKAKELPDEYELANGFDGMERQADT